MQNRERIEESIQLNELEIEGKKNKNKRNYSVKIWMLKHLRR